MKIRLIHKILGGFVVVLALMAVVAAVGIIQLNKAADRSAAMYRENVLGVQFALETRAHMLASARDEKRAFLAADPAHAATLAALKAKSEARWDLDRFDAEVRASQARRWVVYEALRNGSYFPWDYQPLRDASERYMRNHMDLNVLEENKRFPRGE